MNENGGGEIPASDKQIALIVRLMDRLNLDLDEFLTSKGHDDLQGLTGGRGGTARRRYQDIMVMLEEIPPELSILMMDRINTLKRLLDRALEQVS